MPKKDERHLPNSVDAEQAIIGALLIDNSALGDIFGYIKDEKAFYSWAHQQIFKVITALNSCNLPADITTVADELDRWGMLGRCGGRSYLAELSANVATAANAGYYAKILAEKLAYREMIALGAEITSQAYAQIKDPAEIANHHSLQLYSILHSGLGRKAQPLSEIVPELMVYLDNVASGVITPGMLTGFTDLDRIIAGFQNGELIIIGARPTVGKTAFMSCCAINIVKRGIPAFFISAETAKGELALRIVCTHGSFNSIGLKRGAATDHWDELIPAMNEVSTWPLYIEDTAKIDIATLVAKVNNFHKAGKANIVFVDHIQNLTMSNSGRMPKWEQVAYITATLKALAMDLDIPVVAASQLTPKIDERRDHRPRLSDFRDSHDIEQTADKCIGLHRPELYASKKEKADHTHEGVAEAIILKHRNGPIGTAKLFYNKTFTRFENIDDTPF